MIVFFVANRSLGIFGATAVFVTATLVVVAISFLMLRRISPILLFNAVLVAVFGGLTLLLHDALFIKIKPTVDYAMFAGLLTFGLATDRLFLKSALGMAFADLKDQAWRVLTRNWALFFSAMAIANELVWRSFGTDAWVAFRVWVPPVATLVYTFAHVPYLLRDDLIEVGAPLSSCGGALAQDIDKEAAIAEDVAAP